MKLIPFVLLISGVAFGQGPARQWYEENFEARAANDPRMRAMAPQIVLPNPATRFLCGAISQAQFKHRELFVGRTSEPQCLGDDDCAIGSLGGFCNVGTHKSLIDAHNIYLRSPAYAHLHGEWTRNRCMGPMGMCLPVNAVHCHKEPGAHMGVCRGERNNNPPGPGVFMAAPLPAPAALPAVPQPPQR